METRLLLLLVLSPTALGLMVARCPEGWKARGNTDECYKVHSYGSDRTFDDARIYCQARGGDLAYIISEGQRDWLGQLVAATGNVGQNAYMWVGARNVGGSWKWIENDEPLDNMVVQWEGTGEGDCAALTLNSKLIKQDCGQRLKFICHRNIQIPMACDHTIGWEDADNKCYKKSTSPNSWHDAEIECSIEGGHLVSIGSDSEQQLAHDLALEERDKVWIGYTEEGHPGTFTWVDGTSDNKTYWHDGQPDTSYNGYGAAVVDNDDPSGLWVVEKVTQDYHYLCEKPTGSCLPGWEEFKSSCYYFNTESTDLMVWEDARTTCSNVKARMVVLDTEEEDVFFRSRMPESDKLWIGLYSKTGDDIYWTDDSLMSSKNFTHMSDDDKAAAIANKDQQCVYLEQTTNADGEPTSSWIPTDCLTPRHYACEADVGAELSLIPPSNERYCRGGDWKQHEDFCYLFLADEKSWTQAEGYCQGLDISAHLVSVLTWGEQDFVFNNELAGGWIGLNQREEESWRWSDGSIVTIQNWEEGEPNGDEETCVEMYFNNGKWNDIFCNELKSFSCKMPASTSPVGTVTTTTAIPDTSACGYDWTENPSTGECYRVEVRDMVYIDARQHCKELYYDEGQSKPDLVSIYTPEEQAFVYNLLEGQHLSQSAIWIGMKNDYTDNMWLDGTPSAYFNFADGEPSDTWNENCVEMYTTGGKWNDAYCGNRQPFICEKKGKNYVGPQPPPPPDVQCPSGWVFWDHSCYYFSSDKADWFQAASKCYTMMGSQLTSITNQDENDFVQGILQADQKDAWLGLRDDDQGGNWHWTDGSPYFWTNWGYGEPSNANGEEHCGEMRSWDYYWDGKWNDIKCDQNNYYVCKMKVDTCPSDWSYSGGKCYYVSDFEATRNEGEVNCQEMNTKATLVNIHSQEENQFFADQLIQSSQSCWLGLQYDGANWTWTDGTPMDYSNWNGGEPNNLDSEMCGEMIDYPGSEYEGKWNNLACGESRAFGCELYPTHVIGCANGWEEFEDYCYKYYSSEYVTHYDARKQCQDESADLVSIHSAEENDFVYSLMNYEYYCTYIGLTDVGHHMFFKWLDGTPVVFTQFSSSLDLSAPGLCACMQGYYGGTWNLEDCNNVEHFVCKKPKEAMPLHPVETGCTEGDIYYEASCYSFQDYSSSWDGAKKSCENLNQQLIALETQFETAYISSVLAEKQSKIWIGLSGSIASDGSVTFSWVNGKPLEYSYWDRYEPAPEHGTCVVSSGLDNGFWGVRNCDDNYPYLCEYDRVGYTTPRPPTTKAPSDYCAYDWEHKGLACYKVMLDGATWSEAEDRCAKFGGHLVSVRDELEQTLILGLTGIDEAVSKYGSVWVGLVLDTNSGYEWVDGTGVDFVNWAEGQPDSHGGRETCVSADASSLKLYDSVCMTHMAFICEAPSGSMMTTATVPTKPPLQQCPNNPDWYKYKNHCYKFISSTDEPGQTWWKAHRLCRDEGGELASILSNEENYWIESMMYDKAGQAMWIGGRALLGTGYEWIDGEPFIYDNWATGEPNNVHDQEDCINMYTNNQGYWNDQNCGSTAGRICKRPEGVTLPPATTTKVPDGHCPEGWVHTGTKCVYFNKKSMNFTIARQVCQKMGSKMDLASIHSAADQAYLTAAMVTQEQHMWIGMRYEMGFYWVDQSEVTYTNWGPGEPNGGAGKEECVEVNTDTGHWNDINCSDEFGSICMMTQDPSLPDHHTVNCPAPHEKYVAYNGECYRAVTDAKTWEEAEATCTGENAHLVSIETLAEDSFVWAAGQENAFSSFWLGLNNKKNLDTYEWSDGWPMIYSNWGDQEPIGNPVKHSCVIMNMTHGSWYTKSCDQSYTFMCKYTNETVPTPDLPVTGICPNNRWVDLNGGYCYLFSNETQKWSEANMICMQENANLASVHSNDEMKLIRLHMQDHNEPFWIGLLESENGEKWTDGTGLDFVYWMKDEPNSHGEKCTEAVVKTGRWNDVDCLVSRYYVCKTPKIQEPTDIPPVHTTTKKPGGDGGSSGKLSGGGIAGIVIAVLFVVAAMGFVGFTYVQKNPKRLRGSNQRLSFENIAYSPDNTTERPAENAGGVSVINVSDGGGSEA